MYYAQKSTDDLRAEGLKSADEEAGSPIYPHDILRTAYDAVLQNEEVVAGKGYGTFFEQHRMTGLTVISIRLEHSYYCHTRWPSRNYEGGKVGRNPVILPLCGYIVN